MKTIRVKLFTLVILIALLGVWGPAAQAFVAPLQGVTSSVEPYGIDQHVCNFSVGGVAGQAVYDAIQFHTVSEGIVAFIGVLNGSGNYLNCWVFNPVLNQWVGYSWNCNIDSTSGGEISINTGVVVFYLPSYPVIFPITYDPQRGWMSGVYITDQFINQRMNQNGLVAAYTGTDYYDGDGNYLGSAYLAQAAIYDPRDGDWKTWSYDCGVAYVDEIKIVSDTALFGSVVNVGYDPDIHALVTNQWGKPMSWFYAGPDSVSQFQYIWFMDQSIGGDLSYMYSFSDGNGAGARSDCYSVSVLGQFVITQTIQGSYYAGTDFTSSHIINVLDITPPKGTIAINNGAQWTNLRTVHLRLTTEAGAMIALKKGATGTYGTEFLYDPVADANLAYDLWPQFNPIGFIPDGTYTIYAKFRDTSNNTFETSASINVDTHKPNLPTLSARRSGTKKITLKFPGGFTDGYYPLFGFWHPGSGIASWSLKRGTTPDNVNVTIYGGPGAPTFSSCIDTYQLKSGPTYYYQLQAMDNAGNLALGPVVKAIWPAPTGALELLLLGD